MKCAPAARAQQTNGKKKARQASRRTRHAEKGNSGAQGFADFLVSFVLTQRIDRPDGCGHPADEGDLQQQADDAGKGAANREKLQLGQQDGENQAHGAGSLVVFS